MLRWTKEYGERRPYGCSHALKRYNKYMGAVDEWNKELAATLMQMGRCKQRFQRSLFLGWLLPGVGVLNVRTAFCELIKDAFSDAALKDLQTSPGVGGKNMGFSKWFQRALGRLLVRTGVERASRAQGGGEPHFMPKVRSVHWEQPFQLPPTPGWGVSHGDPVDVEKKKTAIYLPGHTTVAGKRSKPTKFLHGKGRCHACMCREVRTARREKRKPNWGQGSPICKTSLACKVCRRRLCPECWRPWHDHEAPVHLREVVPFTDSSSTATGTVENPWQPPAPKAKPAKPTKGTSALAKSRAERRAARNAHETPPPRTSRSKRQRPPREPSSLSASRERARASQAARQSIVSKARAAKASAAACRSGRKRKRS